MRIVRKLALTLAGGLTVALAAGTVVAATATGADSGQKVQAGSVHITSSCTNGVYADYCGTQKNVADGLGFAVGTGEGSSDWFIFAYRGNNEQKVFEFAPEGLPSNLCLTESETKLSLSRCTGATSQLFTAKEQTTGFTWQNLATGLYVQDNGEHEPLTGAPADGQANQEWTFTTTG